MRSALSAALLKEPFDAVRTGCAAVAREARTVRINSSGLGRYAATLPLDGVRAIPAPRLPANSDPEGHCAFVLTLDAVNFGSGYFPLLRKRPGHSGYRTIEATLLDYFEHNGPLTARELRAMTAERCATLFDQSLDEPAIAELMALFAQAWNELGEHVGKGFQTFVEGAGGSAAGVVASLLQMPLYQDVAHYAGREVALLKRAQITVADLHAALPNRYAFPDLDALTIFPDNLVPHVLRLDGVLDFAPELVARIERGTLIPWGSLEEVEIRALAVHATEELCRRSGLRPRELDAWLWHRGAGPHYKASPRHRTRCPYY